MDDLTSSIKRLEDLEPDLVTLDTLLSCGMISLNTGGFQVGDFDLFTWDHCFEGFSVGVIIRTRFDDKPFPSLRQAQKKWILCCKGKVEIVHGDEKTILSEGFRHTIYPKTPHEVRPLTDECMALIVVIPADPGM